MLKHGAIMRSCRGGMLGLVGEAMLLAAFASPLPTQTPAGLSVVQIVRSPDSKATVIQGRITAIEGTFITVKTPDAYPGKEGVHAQFVVAGRSFKFDISHARVLLPDGIQVDKNPLQVGDSVVVVLSGVNAIAPNSSTSNSSGAESASIIERLVQSEKVITH